MVSQRTLIPIALLVVYLVWGACFVVTKYGLEEFQPLMLAGLRNLLASAILLAACRSVGSTRPDGRRTARSLVVGLLVIVGGTGGSTLALRTVPAGTAALIFALSPLWLLIFATASGEVPRSRELAGIAMGIAAVGLATSGGGPVTSPAGLTAMVTASFCWAAGSELARREAAGFGPAEVALQMLAGGGVLMVASVLLEPLPDAMPGRRATLSLLFLVVFGSVIAYGCYLFLLSRARPAVAGSHAFVNPIVAAGLGAMALGEPLTPATLAAMALTLGSISLTAGKPAGTG